MLFQPIERDAKQHTGRHHWGWQESHALYRGLSNLDEVPGERTYGAHRSVAVRILQGYPGQSVLCSTTNFGLSPGRCRLPPRMSKPKKTAPTKVGAARIKLKVDHAERKDGGRAGGKETTTLGSPDLPAVCGAAVDNVKIGEGQADFHTASGAEMVREIGRGGCSLGCCCQPKFCWSVHDQFKFVRYRIIQTSIRFQQ